ncbi:MAG: hydroxymethylglutaryl-CoA synthase [Candidatus Peribacteraceae bacterium]|jgi:hydroxymethylglutaryl-CoA synthase|nr:hydroxymethylglutaryl-CoA synthase [Candidatus Peribacteraceae bacterium]
MSPAAIIGFGLSIPSKKITVEEIASNWQQDPESIKSGLGVQAKTVPDAGEDTFTLSFEAGKQAIETSKLKSSQISAVYVGSESHPYAVKPTSGMVAAALECDPFCHSADLEFACKAGTAAMQIVDSMIRSKQIGYGLAIGADCAQSKPGDALEYTAAAGAAAFVMGPASDKNALCQIDRTISFTTDTPDFWRANGKDHPEHAGRFTGEPAYLHHVREATKAIFEVGKITPDDIDHVIFHMPNAKFPRRIAKELGFSKEQLEHGFIVPTIGNTYSACSPLGLAHVLQQAKKDDRILLVSYGSGAGSDAFLMTMLRDGVKLKPDTRETSYINYSQYQSLVATH